MYGKSKERSMIRSVLPSTARKSARTNLAMVKRRNRRSINQSLHAVAIDPEIWDERTGYDYYPYDDGYSAHASIRGAVSERRSHDNLSAFLKWAPTQVTHLRQLDRMSYLSAKLPHNTIGRHAMSHVDYLDEFTVERESDPYYRRPSYWAQDSKETKAFVAACRYASLEAGLYHILETSAHRKLNVILKRPVPVYERIRGTDGKYANTLTGWLPGRPLRGAHDIVAFVEHYAGNAALAEILRNALLHHSVDRTADS